MRAPNEFTLHDVYPLLRWISSVCVMFWSHCAEWSHGAWCCCHVVLNEVTVHHVAVTLCWIITLHDVYPLLRWISSVCVMFWSHCAEWSHGAWCCCHVVLNEVTVHDVAVTLCWIITLHDVYTISRWISIRFVQMVLCHYWVICVHVFLQSDGT